MADDWIGINGAHLDGAAGVGFCGEEVGFTLAEALNGTDVWGHDTNEVHWFILDLGATYNIKKVRGSSNSTDDPLDVDIFVSDDKGDWGAAVASGINTWQDTDVWVEVNTTDKDGRYIKVVINDTEDGARKLRFGKNPMFDSITIFDAYGEVVAGGIADKSANMGAKMIAGKLI